jgi:beta-phosphoglucomutase
VSENHIRAVIFDLDGVITDTAEYHYLAWKQLAESIGIAIDRVFNEQLKGISRMESLERILQHGNKQHQFSAAEKERLADAKNKQYVELIKEITPGDILPGISQLLDELKENGIKIGLASASRNARAIIDRLELGGYFHYIIDAGTVTKGKPDPEIFLKVADALGVPYAHCVGIEDAEAGVEAIKSAGMFAVGVGRKEILAKADLIVQDTSQLRLKEIEHSFCKLSKTFYP